MEIPPQVCVSLRNNDSCHANKRRQDERAEAAQYLEGDSKYVCEEPRFEYGTYERIETKTCLRLKWPQEVCNFMNRYTK
jgi:hypothetical protein